MFPAMRLATVSQSSPRSCEQSRNRPVPKIHKKYSLCSTRDSSQAAGCRRRQVLTASGVLLAGFILSEDSKSTEATELAAEVDESREVLTTMKAFESSDRFAFSYPDSWLVAFDRTNSQADGTIVLVGDFVNVDTLSVTQKTVSELQKQRKKMAGTLDLGPNLDLDQNPDLKQIAGMYASEAQNSPATLYFESISDGERTGKLDGLKYWVVEYTVDTCRGEPEEVLGGKRVCRGPNAIELQTVNRHHVVAVTKREGTVYVINASALVERWTTVGGDLLASVDSFGLKNLA